MLLNPITAKRIALICGSVEAFLADPSKFRDKFQEPNYKWMCAVSPEEAQVSLKRMLTWAKSHKQFSGGSLGEWIFNRNTMQNQPTEAMHEVTDIIMALTPGAAQRDWRTPSEFPCTPQKIEDRPLVAYADNLKEGVVFCSNKHDSSIVLKRAFSEDRQSLYVMTEASKGKNAVKPYALAKITNEDGLLVHTGRTFFSKEGAEKQFTLAQGLEWSGGDSIDDYC